MNFIINVHADNLFTSLEQQVKKTVRIWSNGAKVGKLGNKKNFCQFTRRESLPITIVDDSNSLAKMIKIHSAPAGISLLNYNINLHS